MNNSTNSSSVQPFTAYFTQDVDIVFGLFYVIIGILGLYTNGTVILSFWKLRQKVKMVPFIICAVAVSHSDFLTLLFVTLPYGALLLAGRPIIPRVPCFVIGLVFNFGKKFALFVITSIMVFRCITIIWPLKTRNSPLSIFYILITGISAFCFILALLPIYPFAFMPMRYEYVRNVHECAYYFDPRMPGAAGLAVIVDVVYWGPFITCVISSIIFSVTLTAQFGRMQVKSLDDKKCMAIRKTFILTMFFIVCYLPIAAMTTLGFLAKREIFLSYNDIKAFGYKHYLYILLFCTYVIPAFRAAFTPVMLRLRVFILGCCSGGKGRQSVVTENTDCEEEAKLMVFLKKQRSSSQALLKNLDRKLSTVITPRARSASMPPNGIDQYRQVHTHDMPSFEES